ncbi:hypothetical protein EDB85DRAFT_2214278 [Lactarius pseudohatsudake]|nr:hypothetical protein EDB85DRAFT_2214278 [Lactarius pseudohatsudake]
MRSDTLGQRTLSKVHLTQLLNENAVVLSEALDEKAIEILVDLAFWRIFPDQCATWKTTKKGVCEKFKKEGTERSEVACRDLLSREGFLRRALRESVVDDVTKLYPSIGHDSLTSRVRSDGDSDASHEATDHVRVNDLRRVYPGFDSIYQRHLERKFDNNQDLDPEKRAELVRALISEANLREAQKMLHTGNSDKKKETGVIAIGWRIYKAISGGQRNFLLGLKSIEIEELRPAIEEAETLAHTSLSSLIDATVNTMTHSVLQMQQDSCRKSIQNEVQTKEARALSSALVDFIRDLNAKSARRKDSVLRLDSVERSGREYYWSTGALQSSGRREAPEEPKLEFWVHLVGLSSEDKQHMQSNRRHIPRPTVNAQLSSRFYVPIGLDIAFHHLLENEKLLLVLVDREKFSIYLARPAAMDAAIRGHPIKTLNRDKLGLGGDSDALFAFDEAK